MKVSNLQLGTAKRAIAARYDKWLASIKTEAKTRQNMFSLNLAPFWHKTLGWQRGYMHRHTEYNKLTINGEQ